MKCKNQFTANYGLIQIGYLFSQMVKPMHPSTISKWFVKFVKEIGLPVINFHGLRHTNATLLISQNIDVAVVATRLGHAQITTTFNFYVRPIISRNKSAGNVLQNLLIPN